jgi:acyl-CoA synthetase (AMP-forming)/AMP-acid ligase II
MIISGGYNVYPREVEDMVAAHPGVREVVVVGIPDDRWGEAVAAFVALKPGEGADEAGIITFAREKLAEQPCRLTHKNPARVSACRAGLCRG